MLFHCKPVNQQKTTIFALILWEEQRLNRFWSEKGAETLLSLLAPQKVSSLLLFNTYLVMWKYNCEGNNSDTKISFHDNTFKIRGVVVTSNFFSLMYLFSWCLPSLTFVSSFLARSEVSSMQHYVIQFVNFSQQIVGFVYVGSLDCSIRKQNYCWKCLMHPYS